MSLPRQVEEQPAQTVAQYSPRKLPEMTEAQWQTYQQSVVRNAQVHKSRKEAVLAKGAYLYHATSSGVLDTIKLRGLLPADPTWRKADPRGMIPRYDASKDGFLSMATAQSTAGAMGGKTVLLRMQIGDDIAQWDFRANQGGTEVRTQRAIPPERLEYLSEDKKWVVAKSISSSSSSSAAASSSSSSAPAHEEKGT